MGVILQEILNIYILDMDLKLPGVNELIFCSHILTLDNPYLANILTMDDQ